MHPDTPVYLNTPEAVAALCQSCGACCAAFRVSFYWAETTAHPLGAVPEEMTSPLTASRACMKGTSSSTPRCCGLEGEIGRQVSCTIYPLRSSTCREYQVFAADGSLNPRCNVAREKHGLPALEVYFQTAAVINQGNPCMLGEPIGKNSLALIAHPDSLSNPLCKIVK